MKAEDWLNEALWCGETRRRVIWQFAQALVRFIEARGYAFQKSPKEMSSGIATLLYHNRGHTLVTPVELPIQDDYSNEHRQYYNHVIDPRQWEAFWGRWAWWEDVSSDFGFYRKLDIEEYCWSQINLDLSPQTRVVEDFMEEDMQAITEED